MSSGLFFDNKKYISAKEAGSLTGYSRDYIGQLARGNKIDSRKIRGVWYVEEKSILQYKNFDIELGKSVTTPTLPQTPSEPLLIHLPPKKLWPEVKKIPLGQNLSLNKKLSLLALGLLLAVGMFSVIDNNTLNKQRSDVNLAANVFNVVETLSDFLYYYLYGPEIDWTRTVTPKPIVKTPPNTETVVGSETNSKTKTESPKVITIRGPAGPRGLPGPQGPEGRKGDAGITTYNSTNFSQPAYVPVSPAPIGIIPPSPVNNYSGGSLFSATDLSSRNFITENAKIANLTVSGNSTLQGALNVAGDSSLTGDLTVAGTINGNLVGLINPGFTTGSVYFQGVSGVAQDNANFFYDNTNNRLGLGTTTPTSALDLRQTVNGEAMFYGRRFTDVAPSGDFIRYNNAADDTTLFRVDNSGNLFAGGIINSGSQTITSTSTPQFRVQYDANNENSISVSATGTTTYGFNGTTPRAVFVPQTNSITSFQFQDASLNTILNIDTTNQRVGIGTTNPAKALSVSVAGAGVARFTGTGGIGTIVDFVGGDGTTIRGEMGYDPGNNVITGTTAHSMLLTSKAGIHLITNNALNSASNGLTISTNGNVGIGTTTPTTFKLEVAGSVGPEADNTRDLGSSGRRWANLYATSVSSTSLTASGLTPTRVTFAGTAGLLTDDADLTFVTDTLTSTKLLAPTSVSTPSLISTGALTITPNAGSNLNIALSTTGDFAVNTNQLYVDTSAGNVGIGTTDPGADLEISNGGANSRSIRLDADSAGVQSIYSSYAGTNTEAPLVLGTYANRANQLYLATSGMVGIGTASPVTNSLQVVAQAGGRGVGILTNSATLAGAVSLDFYTQANRAIGSQINANSTGTGGLDFWVNGANTLGLTILSGGNVGIGTTSPQVKLHIEGSVADNLVRIQNRSTSGYSTATFYDSSDVLRGGVGYANSAASTYAGLTYLVASNSTDLMLGAGSSGQERVRVQASTGNVGIGTTNPQLRLHIENSIADNVVRVQNRSTSGWSAVGFYDSSDVLQGAFGYGNSGTGALAGVVYAQAQSGIPFVLGAGGSEKMRITSGGNVGIGMTNPSTKLEIANGDITLSGGNKVLFTPGSTANSIGRNQATGATMISGPGSGNAGVRITTDDNVNNTVAYFYANTTQLNSALYVSKLSWNQPSSLDGSAVRIDTYLSNDSTTAISGTAANFVSTSFAAPTLGAINTGVTTTNAYNLYISGAPIKGTNNTVTNAIALGIAAGAVGAQTNSYGLYVNAQTGATNNYAATFMGGNVGIGTTAPQGKLDVSGIPDSSSVYFRSTGRPFLDIKGGASSYKTLRFSEGADGTYLWDVNIEPTTNNMEFWSSQSASMLVPKLGVGIAMGTTPAYPLEVSGSSITNPIIVARNAVNSLDTNWGSLGILNDAAYAVGNNARITFLAHDASQVIHPYATIGMEVEGQYMGALTFNTRTIGGATGERMRVTNTGNLGIGTTTPLLKLDVAGSERITGTATSELTGDIDPTASTTVTGVNTLFTTELVVGDRITVSGETHTVTAIASNTSLTVDEAFTDLANDTTPDKLPAIFIARNSASAVKMMMNDLGNVGIGTTSPQNALQVTGNIALTSGTTGKFIFGSYYADANNSLFRGSSSASTVLSGPSSGGAGIRLVGDGNENNVYLYAGPSGIGIGTTTPSSKLDVTTNTLGITQTTTSGLALVNTSPAAAGAQQISPALRWSGSGWKTDATAASQAVAFRSYVVPVQGTASPTGYLTFESSINGGAYANKFTIDSSGNVGIGIINPGGPLEIGSGATSYIKVTSSAGGRITFNGSVNDYINTGLFHSSGDITIGAGGSSKVILTDGANTLASFNGATNGNFYFTPTGTGNVGIGTTAPIAKLHVSDGTINGAHGSPTSLFTAANQIITSESSIVSVQSTSAQAVDLGGSINLGGRSVDASTSSIAFAHIAGRKENGTSSNHAGYLQFGTSDSASDITEKMRITSAGNVGIGTTSPGAKLEVAGNIRVGIDGSDTSITFPNSVSGFASSFATAYSSNLFTITGASNLISMSQNSVVVGSGLTPTNAYLEVNKGNHFVRIGVNNSEAVRVINGGNVGIGTTNPGTFLEVAGTSAKALTGKFHTSITDLTTMGTGVGGGITFTGYKTAQSAQEMFAGIDGYKENATPGNAAGAMRLFTQQDGSGLVERMRITSTGNVGIGTTNPQAQLAIKNGDVNLELFSDGADSYFQSFNRGVSPGYDGMQFLASQYVFNQGNVGIGTTNPGAKADIFNATNGAILRVGSNSIVADNVASLDLYAVNGAAVPAYARVGMGVVTGGVGNEAGFLTLSTISAGSLSEKMRITSTGNVGIGTTNPLNLLNLYGTDGTSYLRITDAVTGVTATDGMRFGYNAGVLRLQNYETGGTDIMNATDILVRIKNDGNVGIGTTTPAVKLHAYLSETPGIKSVGLFQAYGTTGATTYGSMIELQGKVGGSTENVWQLQNSPGGAPYFGIANTTTQGTAATPSLVITTGGNVGIGITNPTKKLDVVDNINGTYAASTQQIVGRFFNKNNGGTLNSAFISLQTSADNEGSNPVAMIGVVNEQLLTNLGSFVVATRDGAGVSERMRITSTGNVGIGVTNPKDKLFVASGGIFTDYSTGGATNGGALWMTSSANNSFIGSNQYYNGVDRYARNGGASRIMFDVTGASTGAGDILFYTAPSGLADNATTFTNVMTIKQNGNVGIGTTNPGYKLHVVGTSGANNLGATVPTAYVGNIFQAGITAVTNGFTIANDASNNLTYSMLTGGQVQGFYQSAVGNVGIGITNPSYPLDVNGIVQGRSYAGFGSASANPYFTLYASRAFTAPAAANPSVGIRTDGAITGFATAGHDMYGMQIANAFAEGATSGTHPLVAQLYVAGGAITTTGAASTTDAATLYLSGPMSGATNNYALYSTSGTNYFGGNVGVGTTAPGQKLQVAGGNMGVYHASAADTAGYAIAFSTDGGGTNTDIAGIAGIQEGASTRSGSIRFTTGNAGAPTEKMRIMPSGNVGVGDTTPDALLDVKGTVCLDLNADEACTDNTAAISDSRLKTNVTDIVDGLSLIGQLHPVRFTWNGEYNTGTANSLGFLAQEVETIFPELVITDTAGYKNLDYSKLTAVLAKAVQELNLNMESMNEPIPSIGSFGEKFYTNLFARLIAWFADSANGIGNFFASSVHTKEICVAKADGTEFCVSGDQLEAMVGGAGTSSVSTPDPTPTDSTSSPQAPDTTAPIITLTGDATMNLNVGDIYNELGATAVDDVDGSVAVVITGGVDTATVGTYTVQYNAVDTAGNNAIEVIRTINVTAL